MPKTTALIAANPAITVIFSIKLAGIGLAATYNLYAFAALLSAVFVFKFAHQTKGLEIEQMSE